MTFLVLKTEHYVCIYTRVCTCSMTAYTHTHCTCGGQRSMSSIFITHHLLLRRQDLLLNQELTISARLSSQPAPGIQPLHWDYIHVPLHHGFGWIQKVSGPHTCAVSHFTYWIMSPSPKHIREIFKLCSIFKRLGHRMDWECVVWQGSNLEPCASWVGTLPLNYILDFFFFFIS